MAAMTVKASGMAHSLTMKGKKLSLPRRFAWCIPLSATERLVHRLTKENAAQYLPLVQALAKVKGAEIV
jgi:hypothetical protein